MKTRKNRIGAKGQSAHKSRNIFQLEPLEARMLLAADLIVDNTDSSHVTITGTWTSSTSDTGFYGSNYLHDNNASKGSRSVTYTPSIPTTGQYDVYVRYGVSTNRATNVPVDVNYSGGSTTKTLDETANGGTWVWLTKQQFAAGTTGYVKIRNTSTTNYVVADAVRFVEAVTPATPTGVRATAASNTKVDLIWNQLGDNDAPVIGYKVQRRVVGTSTWTSLTSTMLPATAAEYFDSGLSASTNYEYQVQAYNGNPASPTGSGWTTSATVTTPSNNNEAPYGGTAWTVAGTIQAEDFNIGGEDVSYNDTTSGNNGGRYRQGNVDINNVASGGYDIAWWQAAEWTDYTVNVTESAYYRFDARVASQGEGGTFHTIFYTSSPSSPAASTGTITIDDTGTWDDYETKSVDGIYLAQGTYTMRVIADSVGPVSGKVGVMDWMQLSRNTPGQPTGLSVTGSTTSSVSLSWTDVTTYENGYRIERSANGSTGWTSVGTVAQNATTFTDSTAASGTTYYYRVFAKNGSTDSAPSSSVSTTTPSNTPTAPSGLTATPVSSTQVDLSWTDNSSNETGFKVERATDSGFTANLTSVTTTSSNTHTYSDTTASPSTHYYYRVRATNVAGDSANSSPADCTTPALLSATISGNSSVDEGSTYTLNLSASGFGSTAIDHWFIDWGDGTNPDGIAGAGEVVTGNPSTKTHVFKDGVVPAVAKTVYATVYTDSAETNGAAATPKNVTVYNVAPTGTIVDAPSPWQGGQTYTLTAGYSDPGLDSGEKPTTYTSWSLKIDDVVVSSGTSSTFDVETNVAGDYVVSLTVTDKDGATSTADTESFTIAALAAPSDLVATVVSDSQIDLTWTDNSSNETGFVVEYSEDSDFPSEETESVTAAASAPGTSVTGLDADTTYYFRVHAIKGSLNSVESNVSSATTETEETPLEQPTYLLAYSDFATQVDLGWNDISSEESGYILQRKVIGSGYSTIATPPANSTEWTDTDVLPNVSYQYRVKAISSSGNSAWTESDEVTPVPDAPTEPAVSVIRGSGSDIIVNWIDVNDEEGYKVSITESGTSNTQSVSLPANTITYTFTDLTPGLKYEVTVESINSNGLSSSSLKSAIARPTIQVAETSPEPVTEGGSASISLEAGLYEVRKWIIDWGDGVEEVVEPGSSVTDASHTYADDGTFNVTAKVIDEDGETQETLSLTIGAENPSLSISGNSTAIADSAYTLFLNAADSGIDRIDTWTIDWGDGKTTTTDDVWATNHVYKKPDQDYTITATATNEDGTFDVPTEVEVHTIGGDVPSAPVTAGGYEFPSDTSVKLKWNDRSDNEDGFKVERETSPGNWTEVEEVDPDVEEYDVSGLSLGASYNFRVASFNSDGTSSYLAIPVTMPAFAAPTNFQVNVVNGEWHFTWEDNADGEDHYAMYEYPLWWDVDVPFDTNIPANSESLTLGAGGDTEFYLYATNSSSMASSRGAVVRYTAPANSTPYIEAPSNFAVDSTTYNSANFSWTDNSSNEQHFMIRVMPKAGDDRRWLTAGGFDGRAQGWTEADEESMSFGGLAPSTTYVAMIWASATPYYTLYSDPAEEIEFTTPSAAGPSDLAVTATSSSTVSLSWSLPDIATLFPGIPPENVDHFYYLRWEIERSRNTGKMEPLATFTTYQGANQPFSYGDTLPDLDARYQYKVRLLVDSGYTDWSNSAAIASTPPEAPSALQARAKYDLSGIELVWQDNSTNEGEFRIDRRAYDNETSEWGSWSQIGTTSTDKTIYTDGGAEPEVQYEYRVLAHNEASADLNATGTGNSAFAGAASAMISLPEVAVTGDVNASELTGDWGQFTVTRDSALTQSLTVSYTVDDSGADAATAGEDYEELSGSVTFEPGQSKTYITIKALADTLYDPSRLVKLLVLAGANYTISQVGVQQTTQPATTQITDPEGRFQVIQKLDETTLKKNAHENDPRGFVEGGWGTPDVPAIAQSFKVKQDEDGKWKILFLSRFYVVLHLLKEDSNRWATRLHRYPGSDGPNWSNAQERQGTLSHEMDHFRTYRDGLIPLLQADITEWENHPFDTQAEALAKQQEISNKWTDLYSKAKKWSEGFDKGNWNTGNRYNDAPFDPTKDADEIFR